MKHLVCVKEGIRQREGSHAVQYHQPTGGIYYAGGFILVHDEVTTNRTNTLDLDGRIVLSFKIVVLQPKHVLQRHLS